MSRSNAARKLPDKLPEAGSSVPMTPQPHGGALRRGGPNGGAGGRPPSALRALAREALADALPELRLVAIGEPVKVSRLIDGQVREFEMRPPVEERMGAYDRLYSTGMGEELRSEEVRKAMEHLRQVLDAALVEAKLPPETIAQIMQRVGEAFA